jgi:orotidine-5'-phosphate decarboxylase
LHIEKILGGGSMEDVLCMEMLEQQQQEGKFLCVGLDVDPDEISPAIQKFLRRKYRLPSFGGEGPLRFAFNKEIIRATHDLVCCYKLNRSFCEGMQGIWAAHMTTSFLRDFFPHIPLIFDAKYGDVKVATQRSAAYAFEDLKAHAVTVNPYGGKQDGIDAFLDYKDRGVFVWCHSSNEGASDFQIPERLAFRVALKVHRDWNEFGNCGLVIGATYPAELYRIRQWVGRLPILVPGSGAQGGDLRAAVKAAMHTDPSTGRKSLPAIFNFSRDVIFASRGTDFREQARGKVTELADIILDTFEKA